MKFSVVIPLFNKEKYILDCIQSVLNQTLPPSEIIVVNDGSTDASYEIVKSIDSPLIKVLNQENQGLSATRNRGIKLSNENFVAFLDADDQWHPDFLFHTWNLHNKFPEASIYGSSYFELINRKLVAARHSIPKKYKGKQVMMRSFFECNFNHFIPNMSTLCIKKNDFPENIFNASIDYHEDVDFFLRFADNLKIAFTYLPLAYINTEDENRMSSTALGNKRLPDLSIFEKHYTNNDEASKFINQQRLKYLMLSKKNNDLENIKIFKNQIDHNLLSFQKKLLILLPNKLFLTLVKFKRAFRSWRLF